MSSQPSYIADSISAECEDLLFRFDEAWHSGEEPDIGDYVDIASMPLANEVQLNLLAELIMIDLECRWRKGMSRRSTDDDAAASTIYRPGESGSTPLPVRPRIEDYVDRFTVLRQAPDDRLAELVAQEYRVRQRWADHPRSEEFASRFPRLAIHLAARLKAIDAELAEDPEQQSPPAAAIAHFELLAVLGEGGMGTVYRALDTRVKRVVALKIVRSGRLASPAEHARFQAEANMVADLDHPNIVPLFEAGKAEDIPYFSMKLIDGTDLSRVLPETMVDVRRAAGLVAQIADAIHYAHQRGILHRDLKPGNVLIDAAGNAHVTDFGLAKRIDSDTLRTRSGDMLGTLPYMSPEQAAGRIKSLTTATDVYGLGAVLYALLTAKAPFSGETPVEVQRQVLEDDPRSCRQLNPRVDVDLEAICQTSMDKDPNQRYGSAAELADDLRRWLAHEPVRARRISAARRVWRWCRRKPLAATLAAVAAVLVLTLAVGVPVLAVQTAYLREIEFLSSIGEIRQWRESREEGWRAKAQQKFKDVLAKEVDPDQLPGVRSELVATHETFDAQPVMELKGDLGDMWSLAFDKRGETLAGLGYDRALRVWDVESLVDDRKAGDVHRRAVADKAVFTRSLVPTDARPPVPYTKAAELPAVRRHPRGYLAVATPTSQVIFLDPQGSRDGLPAAITGTAPARSIAFDAAGEHMAVGWGDGSVVVYKLPTGEAMRKLELNVLNETNESGVSLSFPVALSADGKWLAATHWIGGSARDVEVRLYSSESNQAGVRRMGTHRNVITSLAFSPDGSWLASGSNDYSVKIFELSRDAWGLQDPVRHVISRHVGPVNAIAFSPDGELLASASHDGTIRFWDVFSGMSVATLHTGWEAALSLAFSLDGRYLAAGGGLNRASQSVMIYELSPTPARKRLPGHWYSSVNGLAVHPSSDEFVTAANDDEIVIWPVTNPNERDLLPRLPFERNAILNLAFSPGDGKHLAVVPRDVIAPLEKNGAKDFAIGVWNWRERKLERLLEGHRANVESHAFDATGKWLATGDASGTLIAWDVAQGKPCFRQESAYGPICAVTFDAAGERIATVHANGHLLVRQMPSGEILQSESLPLEVSAACRSTRHGKLYLGSDRGAVFSWSIEDSSIKAIEVVMPTIWSDARPVSAIAQNSNDTLLAVASGRQVVVWDLRQGQPRFSLPPQDAPVFNLAFDARGERLIVCGREDVVTVWNLTSLDEYLKGFDIE